MRIFHEMHVFGLRTRAGVFVFLLGYAVVVAHANEPFALNEVRPAAVHTLHSKDTGPIEVLRAASGAQVKQGEILLELEHARQLHAYKVASLRAKDKSNIRIAEGEVKTRQASLEELRQRARRRLATTEQVSRAEGELEMSQGKLEQARLQDAIQQLDLEVARENLENRFIRSPIDGTVITVNKLEGERANQGEHVITVADLSQVTGEIPLLAKGAEALRVGGNLPVRLAGGSITRLATIEGIENHPLGKDGEKLIRIVLPNLSPNEDLSAQNYEVVLPQGAEPADLATPGEETPAS